MLRPWHLAPVYRNALVAIFVAGLAQTSAHAGESDCKAMVDALIAGAKTPYHSYTTIKLEYAPTIAEAQRKMHMPDSQNSETIFTGTAVFLKLPTGKWIDPHMSADKLREQVLTATSKFKSCEHLPDETENGSTRAVYAAHSADGKHAIMTKIWVANGLPVQSETDIALAEEAGQAMAHQHVSTRSDYGAVAAPKVD